jgi:3-deoxy-D-manno-octulosonate 8-phosphate phosphatase (KDO 8-P phosphatase)
MALEQQFVELGGTFLTPAKKIKSSLTLVKAFLFDWDGVFNDGRKTNNIGSTFSEVDSMGINLLRFNYWLKNEQFLRVFIITGINNQSAIEFSNREHIDGIFLNVKNKKEALESICDKYKIIPKETAFIFDDVLDIEVAKLSGLSFFIGRKSSPLLMDYIRKNRICDYISAFSGEMHAIREICELLIGLSGDYDKTIELRIKFLGEYEEYLNRRNAINTDVVLVK